MTTSEVLTALTKSMNSLFDALETEIKERSGYMSIVKREVDSLEFYWCTHRFIIIATIVVREERSQILLITYKILRDEIHPNLVREYVPALEMVTDMSEIVELRSPLKIRVKAKMGYNDQPFKVLNYFAKDYLQILEYLYTTQ